MYGLEMIIAGSGWRVPLEQITYCADMLGHMRDRARLYMVVIGVFFVSTCMFLTLQLFLDQLRCDPAGPT